MNENSTQDIKVEVTHRRRNLPKLNTVCNEKKPSQDIVPQFNSTWNKLPQMRNLDASPLAKQALQLRLLMNDSLHS